MGSLTCLLDCFDMLSICVCTVGFCETFGRPVQKLNVCTVNENVIVIESGILALGIYTSCLEFIFGQHINCNIKVDKFPLAKKYTKSVWYHEISLPYSVASGFYVLVRINCIFWCVISLQCLAPLRASSWHCCACTITLPMLRLLSSEAHGRKILQKPSKSCHVGINWKALAECFQMSTHLPWFR